MEPTPPEIPERSPSPPSLPPSQPPAQTAPSPAHNGTKTVLAVVIGLIGAAVLGVIGLVAFVVFFMLSASDLDISDEIRAAVLTVEDAEKWFEIETKENLEEWDAERYFDGSAQVYYFYNDEEESIYINCNLTYEPKQSDALVAYGIEWGGLKLANRVGYDDPIKIDEQSDLFEWGDASRFAFQSIDGEINGMAFVARKDGKVFFLDLWGMVLEDADEIEEFILPHLEALERATFRKKSGESGT